jgi:regulatory protein
MTVRTFRAGAKKQPPDAGQAWEYALRVLSTRALSSAELRARLRRRGAVPEVIDGVMAKLKEYGYLNDAAFAGAYANARMENQSHGRARVLRDLKSRQVSGKVAEEAVNAAYSGTDEVKLIEEYLGRKFRRENLAEYLADAKHLAAVFRRLRYAGYSASNSIKVLKRFSIQADELESDAADES